jgi:hypothetical protein
MCIHLFMTTIMEAALMVISTEKYNSLNYRVFISIIQQTQLYRSCIIIIIISSSIQPLG